MMNAKGCLVSATLVILGGCASSDVGARSAAPEKSGIAKEAGTAYYAEEMYRGRVYVLGTEKAHQALSGSQQTRHIAKTYIGAGPDGQTVVLEADPKSNDLQNRLKTEYESRHGTKLP
jgi:hypothetical protein